MMSHIRAQLDSARPALVTHAHLRPTRYIVTLQALKAGPARLAELAAELPPAAHAWRPEPDAWNALQMVSHLAAAEAPFLNRLRRIVEEDRPYLPYFGPDVARPAEAGTLDGALARLRAERDRLVAYVATLPLAAWDRPAVHETMGPTTFAGQVQNILNHDREHFSQFAALGQAWLRQAHV
jgi:hypothetical protein